MSDVVNDRVCVERKVNDIERRVIQKKVQS